ncbi:Type I restriction modification DNA specificity domain protein [anaerobic digester metagenome]
MNTGYKISIYGEIPEEWHIVELGEYVNIKSGESPSLFELAEEGTTPYLKVEDLNNSIKYQNLSRNYIDSNFNHAPKGSIIFPKRGASILLNKIRISKREVLMDSNLMAIFPKDNRFDSEFLFYLINSINLSRIADTSSIPQINNKHITPLKVVYPPLPEQQKIADILTTVDDKLENIESQIAEYTNLKTGLMQQLLTKGIGHTKFVDSELGMIPEGWEVVKIGDLGSFKSGGTPKTNISDYWNGEINWCTPTEITALNGRKYINTTERLISKKGLTNSGAELIPVNSLLVCTRATIGDCAINTIEMTTNQGFKSIVPNERTKIDYLYYLVNFIKPELIKNSSGSTFLEISKHNFAKIKIALPSIQEQQKIANILTSVDDKLESLQQKKDAFSNLKKGLMEQLLTGRIRVKV